MAVTVSWAAVHFVHTLLALSPSQGSPPPESGVASWRSNRGRLPASSGCWEPSVGSVMRVPGQVLRPEPPVPEDEQVVVPPCTRVAEAGRGEARAGDCGIPSSHHESSS